jgi:hypothetical protein
VDAAQLHVVQRVLARNAATHEEARPSAVPTFVQRAEAEPGPVASGDSGSSTPLAAPAPTPGPGAGSAADALAVQTPAQVEKLLDRIYPPLVRRLKTELLIDRERRGVRIDRI